MPMRVIHKYTIEPAGPTRVAMPKDAKVLSVANQNEAVVVWASHEIPDDQLSSDPADYTYKVFWAVPTGQPFPNDPVTFLGTAQLANGRYVAHIFEMKPCGSSRPTRP